MPALHEKIMAEMGVTEAQSENLRSASRVSVSSGKLPVQPSAEFSRIRALSMRDLEEFLTPEYCQLVTDAYAKPDCKMRLRPIQAAALVDAQRTGGLLGLMSVGSGKTLVCFLLGQVFDASVTVVLTQPSLVRSTEIEFQKYAGHFKTDTRHIHVVGYSKLSGSKSGDVLERLKPSLIVADEAAGLKHKTSVRTKRLLRYLKENPTTKFCALSGTLTNRSLAEFEHLAFHALKDKSPVPHHWPTLQEWCQALDADVPEWKRKPGGVLRHFCVTEDESVRTGFRRRMTRTQGVVATHENELGTSIVYSPREVTVPLDVELKHAEVEKNWQRPDGEELTDVLEMARVARQMSCGFFYKWAWPGGVPDYEWLEARSLWHKAVREKLQHSSQAGMDSPLLLANAASAGRWHCPEWPLWSEVKDRPLPPVETIWVSDYLVNDAVAWGKENVGIIWYEFDAFGRALAEAGGFPLYAAGAQASEEILQESGKRTIVASVRAHGTGKNLQMFQKNLVTTPPGSGAIWEQLVGRTHRYGQLADEVTVDCYLHTRSNRASLTQAMADAVYMEETTGQAQKLNYGSKTWSEFLGGTPTPKESDTSAK